ncbi:hypothetical protein KUTeg_016638 [Tegillarca granosa]|uniref:RNB domain-containing protein n=1 Tax=Tegillarca granosa TaxID=220873 RepID=A0ABQ9ELF7_TEGGR|nr:hypothetical protein KUTeg_016638 [Tegillarca granosa]
MGENANDIVKVAVTSCTETIPQCKNGSNLPDDPLFDNEDSDEWADSSDDEQFQSDVPFKPKNNHCGESNTDEVNERNQEETETLYETDVLPVELVLSERYLSQFPGYKFSDLSEFNDDKLFLCTRDPKRYKRCLLEIEHSHLATCKTLDSSDSVKEIKICGRSKCGTCFSDDEVIVEILRGAPKNAKTKKSKTNFSSEVDDNTIYGKVVGLLKRNRHQNIRHPVFMCTIDETEGHLMKPLCKTIPKIHVLNSNVLKNHFEKRRHKVEIFTHNSDKGELILDKYFDIDPAHRNKYIFVVSYLFWKSKSMYPRGAVLNVLHTEDDIAAGLKVVALQNNVPRCYTQSAIDAVEDLVESIEGKERNLEENREDLTDSISVFTIDPQNAKDLDDGLSVETIDRNHFKIGVHIADVTMFVQKDDNIDKEAYVRATTYYPGQGFNPHHMIPQALSTRIFSLLPNERRLALSVFFKITKDGKIVEKPEIKKTVVKSCKKFSYAEVQDIILGKNAFNSKLDLDIKCLYQVTLGLRKSRLKEAMFALTVESFVDDHNSVLNSLQAHWLVEEMMVLTNETVAKYILEIFPESTMLRCQDSPPEETINKWLESYPFIAHTILHLQSQTETISIHNLPNMRYTSLLPLQKWVWESLVENVEQNNIATAVQLLAKDELHPEQALAYEEWICFQDTADYRRSNATRNGHFSLRSDSYVHFTSPIRRFPDLVTHRLLHAALNGASSPYSQDEIDCICDQINIKFNFAKRYHKNIRMLTLAHKLKNDPQILHGFVQDISDQNFLLHFPGLRFISKSQRQINFNSFNVVSTPVIEIETNAYRQKETAKLKCAKIKMQKRLYRYTGFPKRLKQNMTGSNIIDPNQRSIVLRCKDFIPLMQNLFDRNTSLQDQIKEIKDEVNHEMCKSYLYPKVKHQTDVTSEVSNGLIIKHHCEFEFSFHIAQVVAVQMSAEMRLGLLVPKPQMVIMTNDVKCCLMHTEDPVKTLATTAVKFTSSFYHSLIDYIDTWIPLMEMESAKQAATNGDSVTINGISIKFIGRDGKFSHKKSFFTHRDIEFDVPLTFLKQIGQKANPEKDEDNLHETTNKGYIKVSSSDFVCITISRNVSSAPEEQKLWIGHGSITKLRKRREPVIRNATDEYENNSVQMIDVVFKLHLDAPKPPDYINQNSKTCCIEILRKLPFQRRTESLVKLLKDASPLAQAIALGTDIPKLGTGKTYTGIKIVYLFTEINRQLSNEAGKKQIVFCGPSNKSVDLVARWMKYKLGDHAPKFIRVYGSSFEELDFPIPGKASVQLRRRQNHEIDKDLLHYGAVLHFAIREKGKAFADQLKAYDEKFKKLLHKSKNKNQNKEEETVNDENELLKMKDVKQYLKILNEAKTEELKCYDVIFCTTSVVVNPNFLRMVSGRINQCIIDECGMCTEPETLAPIIATAAKQVVLIGDHKQLRPVITCREAAELGLEKSLFERYAKMGKHFLTMLVCQYRMNPHICFFPSMMFYDGKLTTQKSRSWEDKSPFNFWKICQGKAADPQRRHIPHLFCHIEGEEESLLVSTEDGNEQSKSNMAEVEHMVKIYRYLTAIEGVKPRNINVISQYNAQCNKLRQAFKERKIDNVLVNTVFSSQGGEWDYVLFSTVRSLPKILIEPQPSIGWCKQNLGFIMDENQINVALTRARKGLIIIGKLTVILSLLLVCKNINHLFRKQMQPRTPNNRNKNEEKVHA